MSQYIPAMRENLYIKMADRAEIPIIVYMGGCHLIIQTSLTKLV